jgi:hypothetical protein
MLTRIFVIILSISIVACQTGINKNHRLMENEKIAKEVVEAEDRLLDLLRKGQILNGLSIHLNSAGYRNIWNGEVKTYELLEKRLKQGIENGLTSIDYQVQSRDINVINENNVLTTITVIETSHMTDAAVTSGLTVVSILWQKNDKKWRLGYLHASELPKEM